MRVIDSISKDIQFGCYDAALHECNGGANACMSMRGFRDDRTRLPVAVVVREERLEAFRNAVGKDFRRIESAVGKWIFSNR